MTELWMAAWLVYPIVGVGLLLVAMALHAAVRAGSHWPLGAAASVDALDALVNLRLRVPGSTWLSLLVRPGPKDGMSAVRATAAAAVAAPRANA